MTMLPVTIAELWARAAQLRLQAARLDYAVPMEQPATASRRQRGRKRLEQQAADYEELAKLAEADG
ncbi:hypothetical protein [Streptomyces sp. NPDC059009]|uniref:hypothetical protein n=1 Tax=Streptomyces sp. NPDC059009 TaxID=3346694 RepID=UPI003678CA95